MALELKFTVQIDRPNNQFILMETSGNYSSSNPTGWGPPNISRSVPEWADFVVIFPDGQTENTNVTSFIKGGQLTKVISSFKPDSFVDGKYKFVLSTGYQRTLPSDPGDPSIIENVKIESDVEILDLKDIFKLPYKFIVEKIDISKFPDCECNKNILTLWTYIKALESSYAIENTVQSEFLYNEISKLIDG